jgi:hypothetical protein
MLTNLGIYRDIFLPPFLEESEGYFSREGVKKMESCDVPSFLTHVESRLMEVRLDYAIEKFDLQSCLSLCGNVDPRPAVPFTYPIYRFPIPF